jgi:hypothetical protein
LKPATPEDHLALQGDYADYRCGSCGNVVVSGVYCDQVMFAEVELIALCGRCRANNRVRAYYRRWRSFGAMKDRKTDKLVFDVRATRQGGTEWRVLAMSAEATPRCNAELDK